MAFLERGKSRIECFVVKFVKATLFNNVVTIYLDVGAHTACLFVFVMIVSRRIILLFSHFLQIFEILLIDVALVVGWVVIVRVDLVFKLEN